MRKKNLRSYLSLFSDYCELRFHENRTNRIIFVNGNLNTNDRSAVGGVSARAYRKGSWGFSSHPIQTKQHVKAVIQSAYENAGFLFSRQNLKKPDLPVIKGTHESDFSTSKKLISSKERTEFVKEIDTHIQQEYKNLLSRTVVLSSIEIEKNLITSNGSECFSNVPRTIIYISLTLNSSDGPVEIYDLFGGLGQFEDLFTDPNVLFPKISQLYGYLAQKAEGVFAEAGNHECVLDADLAGILAHEAIGHTTEADFVLSGSVAGNYMNKAVASQKVSLTDFAHTENGRICPIPLYIDDEGTPATDVRIIENGVLKSYLHNNKTAQFFNTSPTGNARGFKFSDEPLIRMRNTAILAGEDKLDDMIRSVKNGYYLMKTNNGQADTTSEFTFGITLGYEIKNGKLGRAIRDTTISGIAFDVLKSVTMVSDEIRWAAGGMCGKKQMIPVGMGGPALKCKVNIGGR